MSDPRLGHDRIIDEYTDRVFKHPDIARTQVRRLRQEAVLSNVIGMTAPTSTLAVFVTATVRIRGTRNFLLLW